LIEIRTGHHRVPQSVFRLKTQKAVHQFSVPGENFIRHGHQPTDGLHDKGSADHDPGIAPGPQGAGHEIFVHTMPAVIENAGFLVLQQLQMGQQLKVDLPGHGLIGGKPGGAGEKHQRHEHRVCPHFVRNGITMEENTLFGSAGRGQNPVRIVDGDVPIIGILSALIHVGIDGQRR